MTASMKETTRPATRLQPRFRCPIPSRLKATPGSGGTDVDASNH